MNFKIILAALVASVTAVSITDCEGNCTGHSLLAEAEQYFADHSTSTQ